MLNICGWKWPSKRHGLILSPEKIFLNAAAKTIALDAGELCQTGRSAPGHACHTGTAQ